MKKNTPLKIAGIVLAVIIVLIAAAMVTVRVLFPPEKVKALVLPHIQKAVGREVQIERAGFSLFPVFGARIEELVIPNTDREGFSDKPFVLLDDFILKVKVLPLLRKKLEIAAVVVKEAHLLVEVDAGGSFNFDDLAMLAADTTDLEQPAPADEQATMGLPIPISLQKFIIKDASLVYDDRKAGQYIAINSINQRVDIAIDQKLENIKTTGELILDKLEIRTGELPTPLTGLTITLDHDLSVNAVEERIAITSLRASLQQIYINLSGTVENYGATPALDLRLATDTLSLASILSEIPVSLVPDIAKINASGRAGIMVTATGTLDSTGMPSIDGRLFVQNGTIQYTDLPESIHKLLVDVQFTEKDLRRARIGLLLGTHPVTVDAGVTNYFDPDINARLKASVDLGDLKNIVALPDGQTLDGVVEADITAAGKPDVSDPTTMNVDGTIKLDNVVVQTPEVTQPVRASGTVNLSTTRITDTFDIAIGSSTMNLTSELRDYLALVFPDSTQSSPRPALTFSLNSPLLNTNEFLPPPDTTTPAPTAETAQSEAASPQQESAPLLLPAPLPGIDMKGTITNKKLLYRDYVFTNFTMTLDAVNDILTTQIRATMFDGRFHHDMTMNAQNHRDLKIASVLNIHDVKVDDLLRQSRSFIPADIALGNQLRELDKSLSGAATILSDITTNGGTVPELQKNVKGTVKTKMADGAISGGTILKSVAGKVEKFLPLDRIDFRSMSFASVIKDEKVSIDTLTIASAKTGNWGAEGMVGFNGDLDILIKNRLPKGISDKAMQLKGAVTQTIGSELEKRGGSVGKLASGLVSQAAKSTGPQADKDGRVTFGIGLGGNIAKPVPQSFAFLPPDSPGKSQPAPSPKEQVTKQVKQKIDEQKKQLEAKARQEAEAAKMKAEAEAKKQAEAARKEAEKVEEKARDATDDAKKKLKGKLKKMF